MTILTSEVDTGFPELPKVRVIDMPDGYICPIGSVVLVLSPNSMRVHTLDYPERLRSGIAEHGLKRYLVRLPESRQYAVKQGDGRYVLFEGTERNIKPGEWYATLGGLSEQQPYAILLNTGAGTLPPREHAAPVVRLADYRIVAVLAVPPAEAEVVGE